MVWDRVVLRRASVRGRGAGLPRCGAWTGPGEQLSKGGPVVQTSRNEPQRAGDEATTGHLVAFVALAYLLSWLWWVPMALAGGVVQPGQGWPTHLPGLMGPAVAAFVVTGVTEGRTGLAGLWSRVIRWRVGWVGYGVVAVTVLMAFLPLVTGAGLGRDSYLTYSGAPIVGGWVVLYVLFVNGFGEEIGWRGFLADALLRRHSRGVTALIVWVIWGTWHLPLFWVVGTFRDLGVGGIVGWAVGLGFGSGFLTWLYQSASHSILIVALWHTAYNFTTATQASTGTAAAVSSTAVMVVAAVIFCLPASWRRPRPTPSPAAT